MPILLNAPPTTYLAQEEQRGPQDGLPDLNVRAVITISQANYSTGVVTLIGCNQNPSDGLLLFVHVVILRLLLPYGRAASGSLCMNYRAKPTPVAREQLKNP